jgi:hypothetical protein
MQTEAALNPGWEEIAIFSLFAENILFALLCSLMVKFQLGLHRSTTGCPRALQRVSVQLEKRPTTQVTMSSCLRPSIPSASSTVVASYPCRRSPCALAKRANLKPLLDCEVVGTDRLRVAELKALLLDGAARRKTSRLNRADAVPWGLRWQQCRNIQYA